MMLVQTEIKPSPLHGLGLFSLQHIKKGELVWKFSSAVDKVFTQKEYFSLAKSEQEIIDLYGYYAEDEGGFVLCGDAAKYTNHSSSPNIKKISSTETIALRDIFIGEEITEDYYSFDELAGKKLPNTQHI